MTSMKLFMLNGSGMYGLLMYVVKEKKTILVAARFELARAYAHWESSLLKSNALDQLGHATE
jgi:hypothetical protein